MAETPVRDPIQDRAHVTRDRLLEAAVQSFAAVGYEASSTRRIETAAGVKRGLIGYHFGTKEALWKAAVSWWFERAAVELQTVEREGANIDPVARLRYFVRAFVRFSARFPEANRLMIREGMDNDWRLEWLTEHIVRPWYERVRLLFEEARTLGAAPAMGFVHFYYILTGAGSLLFSMAPEAEHLAGIDPSSDAVINAHANALADLLFPEVQKGE